MTSTAGTLFRQAEANAEPGTYVGVVSGNGLLAVWKEGGTAWFMSQRLSEIGSNVITGNGPGTIWSIGDYDYGVLREAFEKLLLD